MSQSQQYSLSYSQWGIDGCSSILRNSFRNILEYLSRSRNYFKWEQNVFWGSLVLKVLFKNTFFLAQNNTIMPQPPSSPYLFSHDFFLLPRLKRPMKERFYATIDELKTASKQELKKIKKMIFWSDSKFVNIFITSD